MKKIQHNSRTFWLFFFSYSLVFIIPLILFLYTYCESIHSLKENAQTIGLTNLENCRDSLEGQFFQLEDSASKLIRNTDVLSYAKKENPYIDPKTPCELRELQQTVDTLRIGNSVYMDMFIYFQRSDVVVSSMGTHLGFDQFYGDFFWIDDLKLQEMKQLMEQKHYQKYYPCVHLYSHPNQLTEFKKAVIPQLNFDSQDGIMLLYSFPCFSQPEGQLVFSVSARQITDHLSGTIRRWNGTIYIWDENQNLLFTTRTMSEGSYLENKDKLLGDSTFEKCLIFGEDSLLVRSISPKTGWIYVMEVPQKFIYQDLVAPRRLLLVYALLALVAGICMILYLSWRNSSWIYGISSIIAQWMGEDHSSVCREENEFLAIQKSIENLYKSRCEMKRSIERQKPLLRTIFVEKLLRGESIEEIDWYLSQLNFSTLQGKIAVLQVYFDLSEQKRDDVWMEHISLMKGVCERMFASCLQSDIYYYDHSFELRTMVVGTGISNEQFAIQQLNQIAVQCREQLYQTFHVQVRFAGGNLVDRLTEIPQAYQQSGVCMNAGFLAKDRDIVWPIDLDECNHSYFYPIQTEMQLIQSILNNCDDSNVGFSTLLNRIFQENFIFRHIVSDAVQCLFFEMKGTLLKLLNYVANPIQKEKINGRIQQLSPDYGVERWFGEIREILAELSEQLSSEKNDQSRTIVQIRQYVENHFQDAQMNLNDVANHFKLTPSYLSQLFKEQMDINFSTYLEDLRIQAACRYLAQKMPVNAVAEKVGYNSVYVFRNAFKRKIGVPPSEYRQ